MDLPISLSCYSLITVAHSTTCFKPDKELDEDKEIHGAGGACKHESHAAQLIVIRSITLRFTMYFSYSPQRSTNTRIGYQFEPSKQRIIVTHRLGKEITERTEGNYEVRFNEDSRDEYFLDLSSTEIDINALPGCLLVERKIIDGTLYVKLLKPYGPEEEHDLTTKFPDWNKIDDDANEYSIRRTTSLNDFQQFTLIWMEQISEIKCQTYNLLHHLNEEYKKLNSDTPPFPSPISIRSLKTSVLNNSILYIEAIANFLSSIAVNINNGINGSPIKNITLEQEELDKLTESNGKYIRLEDKLVFSADCISRLTGEKIEVNKGNHNWGIFKDLKKRRDSLTHIKILSENNHNAPTLDYMVASIQITDGDLASSMELLCWFNNILNDIANLIGSERFPNFHTFNDHITVSLVNLACSIADTSSRTILRKYNIGTF